MRHPALVFVLALCLPTVAHAELFADVFTGKAFTQDTDLHIEQRSRGNDFTWRLRRTCAMRALASPPHSFGRRSGSGQATCVTRTGVPGGDPAKTTCTGVTSPTQ